MPYLIEKDVQGWAELDGVKVLYLEGGITRVTLTKILKQVNPDFYYINSFFDFEFSIRPIIFLRLTGVAAERIILAPRGEFSLGALALKSLKKRAFVALTHAFGLYRRVVWHASTSHEADDIRRVMGKAQVRVALDIACPPPALAIQPRQAGTPLRLVFLSRISPMKNLLGAIQTLQRVPCPVVVDVYGPAEDAAYWSSCQQAARQLPAHVQFNYCGVLSPAQVPETIARYDLFFLPTLGENFGHVIAEALGCGLPVLIADTTPWRDLQEKQLGWDIPLDQPDKFVAAIEFCCHMPAADYDLWRQNIRAWALANIGSDRALEQNRQLFMNPGTINEQ